MIIRSQDKKGIVNLNNIDTICIEKNHCGCDVVCFNGIREFCSKIGEYSTEEKAIKVLDMICNFADDKHYETVVAEMCGGIDGVVFQMPQDCEV